MRYWGRGRVILSSRRRWFLRAWVLAPKLQSCVSGARGADRLVPVNEDVTPSKFMSSKKNLGSCNTSNSTVLGWIEQQVKLCEPSRVFWCDGSAEEKELLT